MDKYIFFIKTYLSAYRRQVMVVSVVIIAFISVVIFIWALGQRADKNSDQTSNSNKTETEQSTSSATPSALPGVDRDSKPIVWDDSAQVNRNVKPNTPEAKASVVVSEVGQALQSKDGKKLHSLLGKEMQELFTAESVINAMSVVDGLTIKPTTEIKVDGEWARQEVLGTDSAGKSEKYAVVLHLEDGQWKLYGTEKL